MSEQFVANFHSLYGAEKWIIKVEKEGKRSATEMDFWGSVANSDVTNEKKEKIGGPENFVNK